MTSPDERHIVVLPKFHNNQQSWNQLVERSKTFRLKALQESPEAFAMTYATAKEFTDEMWHNRLKNPKATTIVILDAPKPSNLNNDPDETISALLGSVWLALTVLFRRDDDSVDEERLRTPRGILYVLNGVYVIPAARSRGIGTALLRGSFKIGDTLGAAEGFPKVDYQVRVVSRNLGALKLYEKAGFKVSGEQVLQVGEKERDGKAIPAHEETIFVMDLVPRWGSVE
jgi:ribosomal protein S18 acetylase RimI-like enzyme